MTADAIVSVHQMPAFALTRSVMLAGLVIVLGTSAYYLKRLTFTSNAVVNETRRGYFVSRDIPGFIQQDANAADLQAFRRMLPTRRSRPLSLERGIELRTWVRSQQSDDSRVWDVTNDQGLTHPRLMLQEIQRNVPGACRRFTYILVGALVADGYLARITGLSSGFDDSDVTHVMAEAWIADLNKWVVLDAMYDVTLLVNGTPASALELHDLHGKGSLKDLSVRWDGLNRAPSPARGQRMLAMFRHLTIANTNALFDGYGIGLLNARQIHFVHLVDGAAEPYPNGWKTAAKVAFASSASALIGIACFGMGGTVRRRRKRSLAQ